jgi:hypothetical protein
MTDSGPFLCFSFVSSDLRVLNSLSFSLCVFV